MNGKNEIKCNKTCSFYSLFFIFHSYLGDYIYVYEWLSSFPSFYICIFIYLLLNSWHMDGRYMCTFIYTSNLDLTYTHAWKLKCYRSFSFHSFKLYKIMRGINSKIRILNSVECGRPSKTDGPKKNTTGKKYLNLKLFFS